MVTARQVLSARCGRGVTPEGLRADVVRVGAALAGQLPPEPEALEEEDPMKQNIVPPLFARGTFTGAPGHFRGWCLTASQGGSSGGYHWVGRQFGGGLVRYEPHDLEPQEWLTLVDRMWKQCFQRRQRGASLVLGAVDREGLKSWLHRHFPLMMKLVPKGRFEVFLDGFVEAYTEGEMMDDFPGDFEPVEVNLDDPCNGDGYIRAVYYRPYLREVVYQCPAPACHEASGAAVKEYAARMGLPIVDLGDTIATVRGLSDAAVPPRAGS